MTLQGREKKDKSLTNRNHWVLQNKNVIGVFIFYVLSVKTGMSVNICNYLRHNNKNAYSMFWSLQFEPTWLVLTSYKNTETLQMSDDCLFLSNQTVCWDHYTRGKLTRCLRDYYFFKVMVKMFYSMMTF